MDFLVSIILLFVVVVMFIKLIKVAFHWWRRRRRKTGRRRAPETLKRTRVIVPRARHATVLGIIKRLRVTASSTLCPHATLCVRLFASLQLQLPSRSKIAIAVNISGRVDLNPNPRRLHLAHHFSTHRSRCLLRFWQ